ncbi:MAG TPA: redoxin [Desulfovibrio sp.]|nr:redoxin [Desulfovibrio sp.]
MRKTIFILLILLLAVSSNSYAGSIKTGDTFPDIPLTGKLSDAKKKYLGLKGAGPWMLQDINSDYTIIEVYSMYCPHCQKEAPTVNSFYKMLNESKEYANIKFCGLAAGNTEFEIDFFTGKFGVEFPIFSDPELEIHNKIGQPGTPHFYMLRKDGNEFKVLLSHEGPFESADEFLKTIQGKL